jgi:HAE1 family hydrophobic/amphiphilic exporter-1
MPSVDQGEIRVSGEMDKGTRLEITDERFREVESIVMEAVPEAQSVMTSVGGGFQLSGSHTAQIIINLKPARERSRSDEMIAMDLRKKLGRIPGMLIRTRTGGGFFLLRMGGSNTERIQVDVYGYDLDTADALAKQVQKIVEKVEGVTDAQLSRESGIPEEFIIINRQKAADMKLTVSDISNTLQTILSGKTASYYREGGREYGIVVKLKNAEMLNIDDILDLTITNADGEPVVLRNVVNTTTGIGPVRIERLDQERVVTVFANTSGRDLGSVAREIKEELRKINIPRNFSINIGGDYEEQQKTFKELILSIVLALVLIYMVMASLYESLLDPFIVMFSIPFAAIGVILMLFLTHTTLNIQSGIGILMLGGIVVNNAILLVDHTKLLRTRDKMPLREAIEEAGRRRLRPILMTALTTIFALIPLALGFGEGGQAQAPLARAVVGGLVSSTPVTLVLIPTLYYVFEKGREKEKLENNKERMET